MTKTDGPIIEGMARELPTKRRLYRSTTDRAVAGVAGGLGDYFSIDPGLVRVGWLAASLLTLGGALALYAVLAWLVPQEPAAHAAVKIAPRGDLWPRLKSNPAVFWGAMLLLSGIVWLLNNLNVLPWRLDRLWGSMWSLFAPLLVIGFGVYLVLVFVGRAPDLRQLTRSSGKLRQVGAGLPLRRSRTDRQIAGVCGGIAAYLNIDSLVVRIAWALFTVATGGPFGVLLYLLAMFAIPQQD
ncbi:MAG: PspC domain-containing protein [Anaerolineae bacterium]